METTDTVDTSAPAGKKPGGRKQHAALVVLVVVTAAILVLSAMKVYEVWGLPSSYKDLNAKSLAKIQKLWQKYEGEFINKDGRTHGYTIAVISDNHSSRRTFSAIVRQINADNAQRRKDWLDSKAKLAKLQADKSMPEAEKQKKIADLETYIDDVHKMQKLFVIDCGDLAYDGDVTKYRMTLQIMNHLDIPVVTAVGNHDIRGDGRAAYRSVFGATNYSFAVGDAYYIMIDDANEKRVEPEQMKWLVKQLEESKPYNYCFMVMHVPPYKGNQNPSVPMTKFLGDKKNAEQLKDLAIKYRVTFMLAGHIHTYDAATWDIKGTVPAGLSAMRSRDKTTDLVITGGAGARLWKVDKNLDEVMSRAMYHYFEVGLNQWVGEDDPKTHELKFMGYETVFDRNTVKVSSPDLWYTYEEIWVTSFAKLVELYPWEMLILAPLFIVLLGYLLLDMRRQRRAVPVKAESDRTAAPDG
jgi:Icc-related predicted phosphoesterase